MENESAWATEEGGTFDRPFRYDQCGPGDPVADLSLVTSTTASRILSWKRISQAYPVPNIVILMGEHAFDTASE